MNSSEIKKGNGKVRALSQFPFFILGKLKVLTP
jgi:hypothetical protein